MAWELVWGLGVLALMGVMIWGATQYARRNKAKDRLTEDATRAEYSHPETYPREKDEIERRIRPS